MKIVHKSASIIEMKKMKKKIKEKLHDIVAK